MAMVVFAIHGMIRMGGPYISLVKGVIAQKASSRESENFKLKDSIPIYLDDEEIIPQVNKEPSIG